MLEKRYVLRFVSVLFALGLVGLLFACSNNETPDENNDQASKASEPTAKLELKFIFDESLEAPMSELQTLYAADHRDIAFAPNQYTIPADVLRQKKEGSLTESAQSEKDNGKIAARDASGEEAESVADLFVNSSREGMDEIEELGFTALDSRFDMLTTRLVVVAPVDSAVESLEWDTVSSGQYRLASNEDPAAAGPDLIAALKRGEADLALVYATDVARDEELKIVGEAPVDSYQAPLYPAAISVDTKHPDEIKAFLVWMTSSEDALEIWQSYGLSFPG